MHSKSAPSFNAREEFKRILWIYKLSGESVNEDSFIPAMLRNFLKSFL